MWRFKYSISDIINENLKTYDYRVSSGKDTSGKDTRKKNIKTTVKGDVSDYSIERDANNDVDQINSRDNTIQIGDFMFSSQNKVETSQPKEIATTNVVPFDFSMQKFISRGSKLRTIYWRNR